MTNVTSRVLTSTIYEWIVPAEHFGYAVVGEVHDALAMAAHKYKELNGRDTFPTSDDWLKVSPRDYDIVFWFEHREPQK